LGQIEPAVQVYPQHAAPVDGRQFVEGDAVEDSRVAHHRVQAPESMDDGPDNRLSALVAVDRIVRRGCHTPGAGDLLDDLVCDGHVGAFTAH
jgi:hypothetical protein